jgi:hypothetical protein
MVQIVGLKFQPLRVPGGWKILHNNFMELDPEAELADRQLVGMHPSEVVDPWDDVLHYYFDCSYLWSAIRNDSLCQIDLEWSPAAMGDRNGCFLLTRYKVQSVDDWSDYQPHHIERCFDARDRLQVVEILEQWLAIRDW